MNSNIPGKSNTSGGSVPGQSHKQHSQNNICIILLIGIPASGKSYFRTFFEEYFKENSKTVLGASKIFSVSYDNFCKVRNPTFLSECVAWKEERLEVFKAVENITKSLKNCMSKAGDIALNDICVVNSEINHPSTVLFIIDDNMYYRSMRYEYYKLARAYNISFCQIFFNVSLQDALKHNIQRDPKSQVPEYVVEKMFEKLETPNTSAVWEKNSLVFPPYVDLNNIDIMDRVLSVIDTALKCPVYPNLENFCREEAKHINNLNAIHQIDIVLKRLAGVLIKKRIKESGEDPCKISKHFSKQRLAILKEIKDRKVVLPVDLSGPMSKQDIELIQPILSDCLDSLVAI